MRSKNTSATVAFLTLVLAACSGGSNDASVGSSSSMGDQSQTQTPNTSPTRPKQGVSGSTTTDDAGAGTTTNDNDASPPPPPPPPSGPTKQSLVWVWNDYANSLNAVVANHASFTHVSPALYQMNYNYTSGVPQWWNQTTDNFNGLSSTQIVQQVHAAGMKVVPLIFAGAGNGGTDQGIHNVIADSPSGTQSAFITAMVNEAVAKGYDGWNLDWEVDNTQTPYATYGAALESFLGAFKTALHAHNMQLSFDLGTWFLKQTYCSGGTGVVDLTAIGANVDLAIVEAYSNTLGAASSSCPTSLANPAPCANDFMSALNLMCVYVPNANVSIGFDAAPTNSLGNNPIAVDAVKAVQTYGIRNVALWPDGNTDGPNGTYKFADDKNNQQGTSWYSLLANFLAAP